MDHHEALTEPTGLPKVLWLSSIRDPTPRSGAQIYSDALATALAARGYDVHLAGQLRADPGTQGTPGTPGLAQLTTPFRPTHRLRRLLSFAPAMVAQTRRREARRWLDSILDEGWDVVVVSHIFTSWALPTLMRRRHSGEIARVIYSSQNHETAIWRAAASSPSLSIVQRIVRSLDYLRVARCERRLVRSVDGVIAISRSDAAALAQLGASQVALARPGLDEVVDRAWPPLAGRPRLVVVLGSVEWGLKLANLVELLEACHEQWARDGVRLAIGGRIDAGVLADLRARFPHVDLLGAVDDPTALYADARAAIVHEPLGGGFKMKVLSYVAHGVPVIATAPSLEFTDPDVAELAVRVDDLDTLVASVPTLIDDIELLEARRTRAAEVLATVFGWDVAARNVVELLQH